MSEVGELIKIDLSDIRDALPPPPAGGAIPGDRLVLTMDDITPEGKEPLLGDDQEWVGKGDNGGKKGDEKWPLGDGYGEDDVKKQKKELEIPDLFWPVTLVVDNSPSQASNIKTQVLHRVAEKVIHALGLGMKQSEVPVVTFADRIQGLDPITEKNAGNYAGGENIDERIVDNSGKKPRSLLQNLRGDGKQTLAGKTLDKITPSGEFTYFHQVYDQLRRDGNPKVLVVVTDGRFSDDWETIREHLDWLEATDNPPMFIVLINVDEPGSDNDPAQPPNRLPQLAEREYRGVCVLQGSKLAKMGDAEVAKAILEPLSVYANELKQDGVLNENYKWTGTFEPWTQPYTPPREQPDFKEFKK